jgi:DNA-binding NarL/FixJ family response regulator
MAALYIQENFMSPFDRIMVIVLHEDQIIRSGLVAALASYADFEVLDAPDPARRDPAWGVLTDRSIDVVIADYERGVALAGEIRSRPYMKDPPGVIVISSRDREWDLRYALARGVRGYLLFGSDINELAAGVRAVHQGERHFSAKVARRLADSLLREPLTAREEDVLRLVVSGHCNKMIGARLSIAVGTVKSHIRSIFDKLDVKSRTQAIAAAQRCGLLQVAPPNGQPDHQSSDSDNARQSLYDTEIIYAPCVRDLLARRGRRRESELVTEA